jgi:hypothetical protein
MMIIYQKIQKKILYIGNNYFQIVLNKTIRQIVEFSYANSWTTSHEI